MAFATMIPPEIANSAMRIPAPRIAEDPLDIGRQLDELKDLKDGWADGMQIAHDWGSGYGKAPDPDELDWLKVQFASHFPRGVTETYIYPTPEGGVQAEWSIGSNEASLEIDLETHSAEWHCLNLVTDESYEKVVDLNAPSAWEWLANEVRSLGIVAE